jgi:hypothetical protein
MDKIKAILWDKFVEDKFLEDATLGQIQAELRTIEKELVIANCEQASEENDYRPGVETYGYFDLEQIKLTLEYISDRWNCQFRVRWLLDLINI